MKEKEVESGLKSLIEATRQYVDSAPRKTIDMHNHYIDSNKKIYDEIEIRKLQYFIESYLYKFYLANMHLEQLWSLASYHKTENLLLKILKNIFDEHDTSDNNTILYSFSLESFLIQATAFYHFYELYLYAFFKVENTRYHSEKKLLDKLSMVRGNSFEKKAEKVIAHYKVGDAKKNRTLLKELRHSSLHRDNVFPSFEQNINLLDKLIDGKEKWINEISCTDFCQSIQNDMFYFVIDLSSNLYNLEWKPGPIIQACINR